MCLNRAGKNVEIGYPVQPLLEAQERERKAPSHIDHLWHNPKPLIPGSGLVLSLTFPSRPFYFKFFLPSLPQPSLALNSHPLDNPHP